MSATVVESGISFTRYGKGFSDDHFTCRAFMFFGVETISSSRSARRCNLNASSCASTAFVDLAVLEGALTKTDPLATT